MGKKVKIRVNTFETNSSSAHTIILTNDMQYTDIKKALTSYISGIPEKYKIYDDSGRVYLPIPTEPNGDAYIFGNGFDIFLDWEEKFAYIIASISTDHALRKELIELISVRSGIPIAGTLSILPEYLASDIYYDSSATNEIVPCFKDIFELYGSIDHQSMDTIDNCLAAMSKMEQYKDLSKVEKLIEIIFSNRIAIVEDSDEMYSLESYLLTNIMSTNNITAVMKYSKDKNSGNYTYNFIPISDYINHCKMEDDD